MPLVLAMEGAMGNVQIQPYAFAVVNIDYLVCDLELLERLWKHGNNSLIHIHN